MSQNSNQPAVVIDGINALTKLEKAIAKQGITFDFDRLDEADDMRNSIGIIRNELAQFNQIVRQMRANKQAQVEQPQVDQSEPEQSELEPNMKSVELPEDE